MFVFRSYTSTSALLGFLAWVVVGFWVAPTWDHQLLLAGPLVAVPLGLGLVGARTERGPAGTFWRSAVVLQLPAAFLLAGSLSVDAGALAGTLATPWLLVTALIALVGISRWVARGWQPVHEFAIDAGLAFCAVGGVWTVLARSGIQPLDFSPIIVVLTAAHFHFAGFALPIVAGVVGRQATPAAAAPHRWASVGIVTSVPLVAAGITFSPLLEWLAAWLLVPSAVTIAILQVAMARRGEWAWFLLLASSLCLLGGMVLAAVYALAEFLEQVWIDIPTMVRWHGSLNALGFACLGLIGHTVSGAGRDEVAVPTVRSRRVA